MDGWRGIGGESHERKGRRPWILSPGVFSLFLGALGLYGKVSGLQGESCKDPEQLL